VGRREASRRDDEYRFTGSRPGKTRLERGGEKLRGGSERRRGERFLTFFQIVAIFVSCFRRVLALILQAWAEAWSRDVTTSSAAVLPGRGRHDAFARVEKPPCCPSGRLHHLLANSPGYPSGTGVVGCCLPTRSHWGSRCREGEDCWGPGNERVSPTWLPDNRPAWIALRGDTHNLEQSTGTGRTPARERPCRGLQPKRRLHETPASTLALIHEDFSRSSSSSTGRLCQDSE
jgi:hypothetical protein